MGGNRRDMARKPKKATDVGFSPERKGASKNQTAAERAISGEALTRKRCNKCGKLIKQKDLVNVKMIQAEGNGALRDSIVPYHKSCYS